MSDWKYWYLLFSVWIVPAMTLSTVQEAPLLVRGFFFVYQIGNLVFALTMMIQAAREQRDD